MTRLLFRHFRSTLLPASLAVLLAGGGCTGVIAESGDEPPGPGAGAAPAPGGPAAGGVSPGAPPPPATGAPGYAPRRIWKLTPSQYTSTARALFGDVGDLSAVLAGTSSSATEFSNGAEGPGMPLPHLERLWTLAGELAARVQRNPGAFASCLPARLEDRACVQTFVAELGGRAFRRPLSTAERDGYLAYFEKEASRGRAVALEQVARAVFLSPHFLYRTELGAEGDGRAAVSLTDYERASAVSYFLTDGPPDAELWKAAADGRLQARGEIEAQARRLLASPASAPGIARFFLEHLHADAIKALTKDAKLFPMFTPQLADEMVRETTLFVEHVLWKGDGRFRTLLTADFSVLSKNLAALYGITAGGAADFPRLALPAGQRAGVLTQASFLAREAGERETDAVKRGLFVRETFLCSHPPPPPENVNAVPPKPDGMTTARERLARHAADPSCQGCHALIDPLGLPFETYDAIGRHRTREANKTIDPSGAIIGTPGSDGPVADALDLAKKLAGSSDALGCFVRKLFRYAHGRLEAPQDAGWLQELEQRFVASQGDVRGLAAEIVASDAFLKRAR